MIYEQRRNSFKQYLSKEKIQYAMVADPVNVFYYTGFNSDPHERFMALLIDIDQNKDILYVPALDQEAAKLASDIQTIVPISDDQFPLDVVKETAGHLKGALGIEG